MCSMKKVLFSTVAMSALMLMATSCADADIGFESRC